MFLQFGGFCRFQFFVFCFEFFRAGGALGERGPRRFGTPATLTHMGERCRVRLGLRLSDAGEIKVEVANAGQAYSAWPCSASGSAWADSSVGWLDVASSAGFKFTAAILPR